ncbi:MAG: hypothetical protein R8K22_06505 [Mariprofundaceae bacterium]
MNKIIRTTGLVIALAFASSAYAGGVTVAEKGDSKLKLGAKFFVNFNKTKQTGDGTVAGNAKVQKDSTGVALDRAYLTAKYDIDSMWKMRLTLDAAYDAGAKKKTSVFVKYAYFQAKIADEFKVRFGVIGTPWVGYENKLDGHRYIVKAYTDTHKLDSSADAGLGFAGKFADGLAAYDVAIINGKGYGDIASSKAVDFNARVGVYPVKGLTLDAQYRTGYKGTKTWNATTQAVAAGATKSVLSQIMASYGMDNFRIGANYINNKDTVDATNVDTTRKGLVGWGRVAFGDFGVYGRYEDSKLDKTGSTVNTKEKRYVAAAEYFINKNITMGFAVDNNKTTNKSFTTGATVKDTKFGLFAQAKF